MAAHSFECMGMMSYDHINNAVFFSLPLPLSLKVAYGMFAFCLQSEISRMCLLQQMEPMGGIVNNFDCPLYILSSNFKLVSTASIAAEVSFVHECNDRCKFASDLCLRLVENISVDKLHFAHDYDNNMYCLNIFCMNQQHLFSGGVLCLS